MVEIREQSVAELAAYADVRSAFEVTRILDVSARGNSLGGFALSERAVDAPYVKDYDELERPADWALRFDLSDWGFLGAWLDGARVGGAAVAFGTPSVELLEGRKDLTVLWDIRVAAEARRHGVGTALISAASRWALDRGCTDLKVETQNVNVPACRFYAAHGFELRSIDRLAYPAFPDEVQLLWYKDLRR